MMTAVGIPSTITWTPQQLTMLGNNNNSLITATNTNNNASTSSLCSTPVNLLTHANILQSYYNNALSSINANNRSIPTVQGPVATNGIEGMPLFLVPPNDTLSLATLQRQAAFQQYLSNLQPKVDTSKHFHVFVGDLSSEVDNNMLKEAFEKFGEISEVKVLRDAQSLKSRGYGFVTYPKKEDAEKAIQEMNGQLIGRRAVRTNWATRRTAEDERKNLSYDQIYNATSSDNTIVYLGNLNSTTTEETVKEAFSKFGAIKEIKMFVQQNYGFVTYETKDAATRAILEMSYKELDGNLLKCSWGRSSENSNSNTTTNATLFALSQLTGLSTANSTLSSHIAGWNSLYPSLYGQNFMSTIWP